MTFSEPLTCLELLKAGDHQVFEERYVQRLAEECAMRDRVPCDTFTDNPQFVESARRYFRAHRLKHANTTGIQ